MPKILNFLVFILLLFTGCKSDKTTQPLTPSDPEFAALDAEIEKNPKDPQLYFQRAQQYYDKEKLQNALVDLKQAISLDSLNPDYYHLLSDTYLDLNNSDEAIMTLYKVLKMYPSRVPTLLKLAELKYIIEDYDGSILLLNEALKVDGQNAEVYYMLGVNFKGLYNNASKLKNSKSMAEMQTRAINAYQTAVEMNSKLSDGWIALGEIFEEKKDKKALNYYENAILSNPSYMPAHHAKAYYLQNNGDVAQAKSIYRSIIINDPNYTDALKNLGYLYMAEDSLDKAFEQFNTLAGVAPTNHLGFYMRGIIQERQGKVNEALKDYQSAYNLKSDDKDVEYALNKLKSKIK